MTTTGRTHWWPKDCGWWRRERVISLGEKFGAAGPMVLDWLTCEAKAQNDRGRVKSGVSAVARGCFVAREDVRPVLSEMSTIGAVDDLEWIDDRFTCRISGWKADIDQPLDAHRKRQARAEAPETLGSSPVGVRERPKSSEVSEMSPISTTGQDRTEETKTPLPPKGGRQRDLLEFDEQVKAYTAQIGLDGDEAWLHVRGAIRDGKRDDGEIVEYVRHWYPEAAVA